MKKSETDFGINLFDDAKKKKYLSAKAYKAVVRAKSTGEIANDNIFDDYAKGLLRWAKERGVCRFSHYFMPLNNCTAQKRDSFHSIDKDGVLVEKFKGKHLRFGEGDASSFPNGGLRQTFEARGISQLDVTADPFIKDGCLYVPTTFRSSGGCSLDAKTPLIASVNALNEQAKKVLTLLGEKVKYVQSVVGAEQEYFLIDKNVASKRPDLTLTGRTLFGSSPPKGQEFCDHYFGKIPQNVSDFMKEVDAELWKLGIVVKTEHNEVAPQQFELATCYAPVTKHCEQNLLIMETLQSAAEKHGLKCLLHEKPFAYFNGSGKHNNWSIVTDKGENLFEPAIGEKKNLRFLLFIAAVVKAVDEYADLIAAFSASAANDLRLGGNEAPPQTISLFLGGLSNVCEHIDDFKDSIRIGTDRNRTSPFAYYGNKFEFRMLGSSCNIADFNTALNAAVAESLRQFAETLQAYGDKIQGAKDVIRDVFHKHSRIIFDGDNYSKAWKTEAKKRNLQQLDAVKAYGKITLDKNVSLFERHGVLTRQELFARQNVLLEKYCNTVILEGKTAVDTVNKICVPCALEQLDRISKLAVNLEQWDFSAAYESDLASQLSLLLCKVDTELCVLQNNLAAAVKCRNLPAKAKILSKTVRRNMETLRITVDKTESVCPKKLWGLPDIADILFGG